MLNVDDTPDALQYKSVILRQAGFVVVEASTGAGALDRVNDSQPDLVLLDVQLPDIDGFAVCRHIRQHRSLDWLAIVHITSAYRRDEDWVRGLEAGADAYLTQPIDPSVLVEVLRAMLRRTGPARQHASALQRSERRHRELVESAPYGILHSTFDGRLVDANHALARMLKYPSVQALLATESVSALYRSPEARVQVLERLRDVGHVRDVELEWVRADGAPAVVSISSRFLPEIDEIETFVQDITDRRQLEDQLRQAQKMEAVGRLAGGIAHDFNNILTAITGYSDMILDQIGPDKPLHSDLLEIKRAADRAAGLTRQLLAFSRRQVLRVTHVDLNAVVQGVTQMLARMLGEDVTVTTELDPRLPGILADRTQIEQVVMNLAVNARDAMPTGGALRIRTENAFVDEEFARTHVPMLAGAYASLTVSDTGPGIPPKVRPHLFEPFFTTKDVGQGTGLGLATVYGIVKQLGGFIWVESEPGHGATFQMFFPAETAGAESPLGDFEAGVRVPPARELILLVEDDPAVRSLTRTILRRHGYNVLEAAGAADALDLFRAMPHSVDLLLTDVVMPGINGVELAATLRGLAPALRITFMSGYTDNDVVRNAMAEGRIELLEKPFTPARLLAHVRRCLDAAP